MYCEIKTEFKDELALIDALMDTGNWKESQIQVHQTPKQLMGYRGDIRNEVANIIIPKVNVGSMSNDIGFVKDESGKYRAIISEFDKRKYSQQWLNKLKQNYAFHCVKRQCERSGKRVIREFLPDGKQRIKIKGYR